jgi:hypothetical protein
MPPSKDLEHAEQGRKNYREGHAFEERVAEAYRLLGYRVYGAHTCGAFPGTTTAAIGSQSSFNSNKTPENDELNRLHPWNAGIRIALYR